MSVAMTALLVVALAPGGAAAKAPTTDGREKVDASRIDPNFVPAALSKKPITVMVKLAGDPVAVAQGAALDASRTLSANAKAEIRSRLRAQQNALTPRIQSLGGRVQANFTDVLNAVRVKIPQNRLAALKRLPGVVKVERARSYELANENTVDFIDADRAWSPNNGYAGFTGFTGQGVTIAVIDTGIDYYHANFGGEGDPQDFECDTGLDRDGDGCATAGVAQTFPTAKVIGGHDFAGDCYHADEDPDDPSPADENCPGGYSDIPDPDNDPLDCNGHGSHVAGTAAGFGVVDGKSAGTYNGPYNTTTLAANDFLIAPGTAPRAKLLAYKIFGCEGSTYLVVDAVERAVQDGADVINLSVGSPYGRNDEFEAEASDNASLAGTTVVASAGNSGESAYITGGGSSAASRAISVAAMDALEEFPGVIVDPTIGDDISGINMNNSPDLPVTGTLAVIEDRGPFLPDAAGCPGPNPSDPSDAFKCEQLGCEASDYTGDPNFQAGDIAAIRRGGCAFVDKGEAAAAAGASAVIVVNRDDVSGLPAFIGYNPEIFDIPMVGLPREAQPTIVANDDQQVTIRDAGSQPNPTFREMASFTSGGPRNGDSAVKPDVAAPGVAVLSTLVGGGTKGTTLQGTSMAAPAVAGVAALVQEAHPTWRPTRIKGAIVGTAAPTLIKTSDYDVRRAGAGVVQPRRAVDTRTLIHTTAGNTNLDFGYQQVTGPASFTRSLFLTNVGKTPLTYDLTAQWNGSAMGFQMTITPNRVTLGAGERREVTVRLSITAAGAAALPDSEVSNEDIYHPLDVVRGSVVANPTTTGPGIYRARSPFLLAPRALSSVQPGRKTPYTVTGDTAKSQIKVENSGVHRGDADVFAWGLTDVGEDYGGMDLRAAGVQSFPCDVAQGCAVDGDRYMIFAINTWGRWSNQSTNEFDILLDTEPCAVVQTRGLAPVCEDADPEYVLVAADYGLLTGGSPDGTMLTVLFAIDENGDTTFAGGISFNRLFPNGSTLFMELMASELGLGPQSSGSDEDHDFNYTVQSFSLVPGAAEDEIDRPDFTGVAWAAYNPYEQPVNTGQYRTLEPNQIKTIPLWVNLDSYWDQPQAGASRVKGWMIVTTNDANGAAQADLVMTGRVPAQE